MNDQLNTISDRFEVPNVLNKILPRNCDIQVAGDDRVKIQLQDCAKRRVPCQSASAGGGVDERIARPLETLMQELTSDDDLTELQEQVTNFIACVRSAR